MYVLLPEETTARSLRLIETDGNGANSLFLQEVFGSTYSWECLRFLGCFLKFRLIARRMHRRVLVARVRTAIGGLTFQFIVLIVVVFDVVESVVHLFGTAGLVIGRFRLHRRLLLQIGRMRTSIQIVRRGRIIAQDHVVEIRHLPSRFLLLRVRSWLRAGVVESLDRFDSGILRRLFDWHLLTGRWRVGFVVVLVAVGELLEEVARLAGRTGVKVEDTLDGTTNELKVGLRRGRAILLGRRCFHVSVRGDRARWRQWR